MWWFFSKAASYAPGLLKWIPGGEKLGRMTGIVPANYSEADEEKERLRVRAASVDQAKETMETLSGLIFLSPLLPDMIEGTTSMLSGVLSSVTTHADTLLKGAFGSASSPPAGPDVPVQTVATSVEIGSQGGPTVAEPAQATATTPRRDAGIQLSIDG